MRQNEELASAIERATAEADQPKAVAKRLIAWIEDMSTRDSLSRDESDRHLRNVFEAIRVEQGEADED